MRYSRSILLSFCALSIAGPAWADKPLIDCAKKSLAEAVANAGEADTITFTGVCAGPITVTRDGLALLGSGSAVIDGHGADALTIAGANGLRLSGFEVRNGLDGIVGNNGAHFTLTDVNVHNNVVFGISLQTGSSTTLLRVKSEHNGVHGLDLETGSSATVTGTLTVSNNGVFGINVNGSALTLSHASVTASANALGVQIATGANAFLNDSQTTLTVTNNIATGLTVVSGAHMVSFGGTIISSGNGVNGVSVNSKGGLDLDAASTLEISGNGDGLLMQEASVMTVFNNPQFSGVPGFTMVNIHDNPGNGVVIETGSTLTLSNQAKLISTQNQKNGLVADNGVGLTLVNSTVTGNAIKDVQLTFGTRADVRTTTFGTYSCDATVLVRGTSGITCPH